MDKRISVIVLLALLAVILTIVRESSNSGVESLSILSSSKLTITGEHVHRMADTTLKALGIKKENIRPVRNRNDVRVLMPQAFDPILFVKVMNDSLDGYDAQIVAMENTKEKTSVVQVKTGERILKSYIFSKEHVTVTRKGATPSLPKKQTR
ncbi:MAG: hypothetical protein WCX28_09715 [Bacteriovoracaceae bacterium]|nr:hypothetical protein [Bacteroidota bacterium]